VSELFPSVRFRRCFSSNTVRSFGVIPSFPIVAPESVSTEETIASSPTPSYLTGKIVERYEEFRKRAGDSPIPRLNSVEDAYFYSSNDHDAPLALIPDIAGLPRPDPFKAAYMTDSWARSYMKENGYPKKHWMIHRKCSVSVIPSVFQMRLTPFVSFQLSISAVKCTRLDTKASLEILTLINVSSHIARRSLLHIALLRRRLPTCCHCCHILSI